MRTDPKSEPAIRTGGTPPAIQVLQISYALAGGMAGLPAAADPLNGPVYAKVHFDGGRFYGERSEALIRGAPLPMTRRPIAAIPARTLSASDLVEELQTINTQIHRMMYQVERAVAQFATAG